MKTALNPSVTFNPTAQTIVLSAISGFDARLLYGIINVSAGAILYAPATPGLGITNDNGAGTLTLACNTQAMNASDKIMVLYEVASSGGSVSGNGTDASNAAPSALSVLQTFTVTQPGAYFIQNQSGVTLQVIFDNGSGGAVSIQLLASGGSAGSQGADTTPPMSWFTGRIQVCGPVGSQFIARHN